MTPLVARMSTGMYRAFRWGLAGLTLIAAGIAVSGVALLFTSEPNGQWTRLAQRGSTARPSTGLAAPLQDVHSSLTIMFVLTAFVFVAWLVGVVIAEWSWPLVLIVVALGVAVISGYAAGFLAVSIDGAYTDDLRGYGFIFDPGFDNVLNSRDPTGANTFRAWTAVHVLALPCMIALLLYGIRRWRHS